MFTNRFSKITVAIIVVTFALVTVSMIPAAPASSTSEAAHVQYPNGEKAIYASPPELSDVMSAYRLGVKNIVSVLESAILDYRQGEKASYVPAVDLMDKSIKHCTNSGVAVAVQKGVLEGTRIQLVQETIS